MTTFAFTTVEETAEAIINEYIHNNDVTFGEFISSVFIEGASMEDIVEIYNKAKWTIDAELPNITIKVTGGYIVSTASPDPDYPGIDIEFIADDDKGEFASRPRILVEKPLDYDKVRALVWADKNKEDYTKEINFE